MDPIKITFRASDAQITTDKDGTTNMVTVEILSPVAFMDALFQDELFKEFLHDVGTIRYLMKLAGHGQIADLLDIDHLPKEERKKLMGRLEAAEVLAETEQK